MQTILLPIFCVCFLATNSVAAEPNYPSRALRLIVPYPSGGGLDLTARIIGKRLSDRWGQAVVIDNRGGANGTIGAELAAHATPDGYTLFIINSTYVVQPALTPRLPYNLLRDFTPVINAVATTNIVAVSPMVPVNTIGELIELAKKRPGQLTFVGGTIGGPSHLSGELFNALAKIKMIYVPYKGTGLLIADLIGGRVDMTISTMQVLVPLVRSGKLKGLAVTSLKRSPALPELPSVAESGVDGYEFVGWQGFLVRSGTPGQVVDKLYTDMLAVLKTDEVRQLFLEQGGEIIGTGPKEFRTYIGSELKKWARIIAEAKIQPETN